MAGGAAGGSFLICSVFSCIVVKETSSEQNPAWQLRVKWAEKSKSHPSCEHLIFMVALLQAGCRRTTHPPAPRPFPTPHLVQNGLNPCPLKYINIHLLHTSQTHLTVLFDFLGLKHPPSSPGWLQAIRLHRSDNKVIWNLIQKELVDKSHFGVQDAPRPLDLLTPQGQINPCQPVIYGLFLHSSPVRLCCYLLYVLSKTSLRQWV